MLKRVYKAIRSGTKTGQKFSALLTSVYKVESIDDIRRMLTMIEADELQGVDKDFVVRAMNTGLDLTHRSVVKADEKDDNTLVALAIAHLQEHDPAELAKVATKGIKWLVQYAKDNNLAPKDERITDSEDVADEWEKRVEESMIPQGPTPATE